MNEAQAVSNMRPIERKSDENYILRKNKQPFLINIIFKTGSFNFPYYAGLVSGLFLHKLYCKAKRFFVFKCEM